MSRQYTSQTEALEYHRRPNQARETAASYSSRASPRTYPINRTSPQQDNDSDKGDQQPRRRIGLAVRADPVPLALSVIYGVRVHQIDLV